MGKQILNTLKILCIHEPVSYFLISISVLRREYCIQYTKCPVRRTCYLLGVHTLTHYSEAHLCYGHHCPMPPSTSTPLRSNTLYPYCSTMTSESYLGPLALQLLGWGYSLWQFIAIHTRTWKVHGSRKGVVAVVVFIWKPNNIPSILLVMTLVQWILNTS